MGVVKDTMLDVAVCMAEEIVNKGIGIGDRKDYIEDEDESVVENSILLERDYDVMREEMERFIKSANYVNYVDEL
jgi:hypothetical protein